MAYPKDIPRIRNAGRLILENSPALVIGCISEAKESYHLITHWQISGFPNHMFFSYVTAASLTPPLFFCLQQVIHINNGVTGRLVGL